MKVGIAAAGTGGHVFPALAVAEALADRGVGPERVTFFGGDRLEATAVPEAGYELVSIEQRGFVRGINLQNAQVLRMAVGGARRIRAELMRREITAMLAMGGYITGPAALASRLARIPLLLHEQNAEPGLANRWSARLAARVFVAFPAATTVLTRGEVVGNPLRAALVGDRPDRTAAAAHYGLNDSRPVVGLLGGSQGADALNRAAAALAGELTGVSLLHLAGPRQHDAWTRQSADVDHWTVVPFEPQMEFFYAACDVVVARAGALTVSELAVTATPSILVPYPGAAGHQTANAAYLVDAGAAVLLPQDDIQRLAREVESALEPAELERRRTAAAGLGRPDAAGTVADALMGAAGA